MKTAAEELYTRHTEKAFKLLENKRRNTSVSSNALLDTLEAYALFAKAKEQRHASHHHLIALTTFLKGINRNDSAAGFIHSGIFNGFNSLSYEIAKWLSPNASFAEVELFQKGAMATTLLSLGLLELGKNYVKTGAEAFRNELLVRLLANSSFAELRFKALAETLSREEKHTTTAAKSMEALLLLVSLIAFSKEEIPEDFIEALKEKILMGLSEAKKIAEANGTENARFISHLESIELAIEKSQYDMIIELFDALLKIKESSYEEIKKDAEEIKKMTFSINEAYGAGKNSKASLLHLVG